MLTAFLAAAGGVAVDPLAASAVGVGDIAGYAKTAYSVYQSLFGNETTLDDAITKIKAAITDSQNKIVAEIDGMAAADIKACANTAVIEFNNINLMNPDRLQQYAADSSDCVSQAWAKIPQAHDKPAIDEIGFALNIVGPIALAARSKAYGAQDASTTALRTTLVQANQSNLVQLLPYCHGVGGEVVNGRQEVALVCTAYNGDQGDAGTIFVGVGQPLPSNIDYSAGITQAAARTSYPVSVGALDGLLPDPVIGSPGNQVGFFGQGVNLQLAASGGSPPYTWKFNGLPTGLTGTSAGLISGTLSQVGTWSATARVTDSQAQTAAVSFSWTVRDVPMILAGTIGNSTLSVGSAFSLVPGATGGTTPYRWTVTGLPAGLSADASGRVSGTVRPSPTSNTVTFTVTDANGARATRTVVWTVVFTVPNVLGYSQSAAAAAITAAGLTVGKVSLNKDCASPGDVEIQNPKGGVGVPGGTAVNLTVSTCPDGNPK
ncbi:PASTA domain-containing protein [Dactylosporangium vinaceum]|uniref:Ig domain-containing protein n=1 Tax=Dactylosporangium vinaceum TaxID=53362 RepID=A0ABV5MLI5_9ACTN|nr:Ig domain-containing protein [Dactylosporangium vinaceum]UAB96947.1 PASTA domain-containing protein [Dactylosporangium vinaceum]